MRQMDVHHPLQSPRPIRHHQHAVGELHRFGQIVGDEQRRLLECLLDLQHSVAKQEPRLLVQRCEGLVHQQDSRLGREGSSQRNALAHAAGKFGRKASLEATQADHGDEVLGALEPRVFGHSGDLERKGDILHHGSPRKRGLFLKHHADRRVRTANDIAGNGYAAFVIANKAADDVEQGGLAAARRPDDRYELARRDRERHVFDGSDYPFAGDEAFADPFDVEKPAVPQRCRVGGGSG